MKFQRGGWYPRWTKEEDAILKRYWGVIHVTKIVGKLPGRNVEGCQQRASKLKLKSKLREKTLKGQNNFKGVEFYKQILEDFATMTAGQIALKRNEPVDKVRCWIDRAKRYRDRGLLK